MCLCSFIHLIIYLLVCFFPCLFVYSFSFIVFFVHICSALSMDSSSRVFPCRPACWRRLSSWRCSLLHDATSFSSWIPEEEFLQQGDREKEFGFTPIVPWQSSCDSGSYDVLTCRRDLSRFMQFTLEDCETRDGERRLQRVAFAFARFPQTQRHPNPCETNASDLRPR